MSANPEYIGDRHLFAPAARTLIDVPKDAPRVLLLDRDGMTALALAVLLTPEAQVSHVSSVAEALGKLRDMAFSAAVIDPQHIDGDMGDLLELLIDCPVIAYSAVEPSWREYADDYLPKPHTTPRKLWSSLARALGMPSPIFVGA